VPQVRRRTRKLGKRNKKKDSSSSHRHEVNEAKRVPGKMFRQREREREREREWVRTDYEAVIVAKC